MDFATAVRTCLLEKFVTFAGRASRPEYWWFVLAYVLGAIIISILGIWILQVIFSLVLFLPAAAAGARRLQDTGRPGVYIFIPMVFGLIGNFIPRPTINDTGIVTELPSAGAIGVSVIYGIVGLIIALLYLWWLTRPSEPGDNAFGEQPAA